MSRDSRGYRDSGPLDCKVYVGDLGSSASRNEIEDEFRKYGELRNVWVARNPPGFAYVEYKDNRDAQEAVDATDGIKLCGRRIRVEMSTGQSRRGGRGGGGGGGGGGYGRGPPRRTDECCYECGERGHFARDCNNRSSHGSSRRSRSSGSRRYSRSRSRSRSRSYSPKRRYSRSRSRSRSRD